jgi:hypothetical protein
MSSTGPHGRVLSANKIQLFQDGNQIGALAGPNLVEGIAGFGDSVHEALRDLAGFRCEV